MNTRCKRITGASLILVLSVYVILSPRVSTARYSERLFRPYWGNGSQTELRNFSEVKNHEVFFATTDGGKLHGWIYIKPGSRKIILVHPGNSGDIAGRLELTRLLLESGSSVFQYEPRGFGMSPGTPSPETICEDGVAAYDYL